MEHTMNINNLISMIPQDSHDEALLAIQTITTFPASNSARVRCHLSHEFRLTISVRREEITIGPEGCAPVTCKSADLIPTLRRTIYEIDEAIENGSYKQSKPKKSIIAPDRPPAPAHMDIPVWDDRAGRWYDAEY